MQSTVWLTDSKTNLLITHPDTEWWRTKLSILITYWNWNTGFVISWCSHGNLASIYSGLGEYIAKAEEPTHNALANHECRRLKGRLFFLSVASLRILFKCWVKSSGVKMFWFISSIELLNSSPISQNPIVLLLVDCGEAVTLSASNKRIQTQPDVWL